MTAPLVVLPSDAHAFAQAYLDQCLATHAPVGAYERVTHNGQRLVRFFDVHTICQGVPGCCPAVTLLADTSPIGTPGGVVPLPINWPVVLATGAAAVGVVGLFVLMLKHAGRRRR